MLDPTREQRSVLGKVEGALALVQSLAIRDRDALGRYRSASESAVRGAGGRRTFDLRIDQVLAGGEMPYEAIAVDVFACGEVALRVFDAVPTELQAALADAYALLVRPAAQLPGRVKALGTRAPLLRRSLGTGRAREMAGFADMAAPETGPVPETVVVLKEQDQTTPFYVMNLNRYYRRGHGDRHHPQAGLDRR